MRTVCFEKLTRRTSTEVEPKKNPLAPCGACPPSGAIRRIVASNTSVRKSATNCLLCTKLLWPKFEHLFGLKPSYHRSVICKEGLNSLAELQPRNRLTNNRLHLNTIEGLRNHTVIAFVILG